MFRTPKSFTRMVKQLTDPSPTFVSLVSGGANRTPFRAVKSEDAEQEDLSMSGILSKKADGLEFQSVAFKAENYPNRESCIAWLEEGGFSESDYDLTEENGGFIASSKSEFTGETKEIPCADKTVIVGKLVQAEKTQQAPESSEAVAAVVELGGVVVKAEVTANSRKFDYWDAEFSSGKTVLEVLTDAGRWEGLPIGMYELTSVLYSALNNALKDGGEVSQIRSIIEEYTERLMLLAEASKGIPSQDRVAVFDASGNKVLKSEGADVSAPSESVEAPTEAPVADVVADQNVSEESVPPSEKDVEEEDSGTQGTEAETEEGSAEVEDQEAEQASVAKSDMDEIKAVLSSLTQAVADMTSTMKTDREVLETVSDRLQKIEKSGQSRKSTTPEHSAPTLAEKVVKAGGKGTAALNKTFQ